MKKRLLGIVLLVILLLGLTGCNTKDEKIKLSEEYYKEDSGSLVEITNEEIPTDKNYILFTYNNYCNFPLPCDEVFKSFAEKEKIDILAIPFAEFKKTEFYSEIKYAPSVIIIKGKKVIAYLDANSDNDTQKYQDVEEFTNWVEQFVEIEN